MKKILLIVAFLVTLVLGLTVSNGFGQTPTNNAFNCFECCPLGQATVTLKGRINPVDTYTRRYLKTGVSMFVYEYRQNLTRPVHINSFGYYSTTVDACETVLLQPTVSSRFSSTHYLYSDPSQVFRDLYFSPPPPPDYNLLEQDFAVQLAPMSMAQKGLGLGRK